MQEEIAKEIAKELALAYMAAHRTVPESNLHIVAKSITEAIPDMQLQDVHNVFIRARRIEDVPTTKTLFEAWRMIVAEGLTYKASQNTAMIAYSDPLSAWLPKEPLKRRINKRLAIMRYSAAMGGDMYYTACRTYQTKKGTNGKPQYLFPDKVAAFEAEAIENIHRIYKHYLRFCRVYKDFPANQQSSVEMYPPTQDEFNKMVKADQEQNAIEHT